MASFQSQIEALPQKIPSIRQARYYPEIGSTNDEAMRLGREGAPSETLLVADHQIQGKGRLHRRWESPAGKGLYFSLLLRPELKTEEAPLITIAAGLALGESLKKQGISSLVVKWPNDIIVQKKKVAGILTEMATQNHALAFVVLGIGINVSQNSEDFPPELRGLAGSLDMVFGKSWDRAHILEAVIPVLLKQIQELATQGPASLIQKWNQESGMVGHVIRADVDGERKEGKVLGLNPQGHLLIQEKNGEIAQLVAADTTIIA